MDPKNHMELEADPRIAALTCDESPDTRRRRNTRVPVCQVFEADCTVLSARPEYRFDVDKFRIIDSRADIHQFQQIGGVIGFRFFINFRFI